MLFEFTYTQEMFDALPKVIEGESKIIRTFNKRFQIIQYKASVHSHKQQRSGIVEGTDKERMKMTKTLNKYPLMIYTLSTTMWIRISISVST